MGAGALPGATVNVSMHEAPQEALLGVAVLVGLHVPLAPGEAEGEVGNLYDGQVELPVGGVG